MTHRLAHPAQGLRPATTPAPVRVRRGPGADTQRTRSSA